MKRIKRAVLVVCAAAAFGVTLPARADAATACWYCPGFWQTYGRVIELAAFYTWAGITLAVTEGEEVLDLYDALLAWIHSDGTGGGGGAF